MAEAGELRVCNLLPEFLADALIVLSPFQATGTISSGAFQSISDHLNHFFIFVQSYSHNDASFQTFDEIP